MIHLLYVPGAESLAHRMCIVQVLLTPQGCHRSHVIMVAQGCAAPEPAPLQAVGVGNVSAFPSLGCFSPAFICRDQEVV